MSNYECPNDWCVGYWDCWAGEFVYIHSKGCYGVKEDKPDE